MSRLKASEQRAQDEAAGAVVDFALLDRGADAAAGGELLVELRGESQATLEHLGRDGRMHVFGQLARLVDLERFVARAEHAAVHVAGLDSRLADPHERRQVEARIPAVAGDDRAPRRIGDRRLDRIAGADELDRAEMVLLVADHRADERDLVEDLGRLRPMLADLDSRHVRVDRLRRALILRARLGIERVVLARPAVHPQQDHPLAALLQLLGASQQHVAPGKRDRPANRAASDFKKPRRLVTPSPVVVAEMNVRSMESRL